MTDLEPTSPSDAASPPRRGAALLVSAGAFLLYLAFALWLTRPWVTAPLGSAIGTYDARFAIENSDAMANMTFAGWWKFAPLELGLGPLSPTDYLMFPAGASYGRSFDSPLLAAQVALLALALPLTTAYSLAIVLAFALCGFVSFRYFARLWGCGGLALALGACAEAMPFLFQRADGHANLVSVWVIPASLHLAHNFRSRPGWMTAGGLALAPPLLAAASRYILVIGGVFLVVWGVSLVAEILWLGFKRTWGRAVGLVAATAGGAALVVGLAWPMLDGAAERARPRGEVLHAFSPPALEYLTPAPRSWAGRTAEARRRQAALGTPWEGLVGVPLPSLVLLVLYVFWPGGRGGRWTLALAAGLAFVFSLGPELQLAATSPIGGGTRLPLGYLLEVFPAAGMVRCPGRLHVLVFFLALEATGTLLAAGRDRLARGALGRWIGWPGLLGLVTAGNLAWSMSIEPMPTFPPPPVPEFFVRLAEEPGRGAVLDVPIDYYIFARYNYYQFIHKRPLVSSTLYHDGYVPEAVKFVQSRPTLMLFTARNGAFLSPEVAEAVRRPAFMEDLARNGVQYVVIHQAFLNYITATGMAHPETAAAYQAFEEQWRERRVFEDPAIRAYVTDPRLR